MKKFLLILILLTPYKLYAWWEMGHFLVAQIAYNHLTPEAKKEVDRLCKSEGRSPYSEIRFDKAANWMDAIKSTGLHAFNTWHYMSRPYNPTGYPLPSIKQQKNARWVLLKSIEILKNPVADDLEKSFMLRVLAHVAGDAHQPLHVVELFSKEFPKGDAGGNAFKLSHVKINDQELKNLHEAWDFACGEFPSLDTNDDTVLYEALPKLAGLLEEKWPKEELEKEIVTRVDVWLDESYTLAIHNAYNFNNKRLKPNETPSNAYFQNCRDICKRQVALGGYRLAAVLNQIFGK